MLPRDHCSTGIKTTTLFSLFFASGLRQIWGMNRKSAWPGVAAFLLVLLLTYTAASKLLDFEQFRSSMLNQELPRWMARVLVYSLPEVELLTALLLIVPASRLVGLYVSLILMVLFTGYTGLVAVHFFGRVPCSCGGVLRVMGWKVHFVFNLFFLLLTVIGIYRERRARQTG